VVCNIDANYKTIYYRLFTVLPFQYFVLRPDKSFKFPFN